MKIFIYIELDENDADYRSELTEITTETLEAIRPVIDKIRRMENDPYNSEYNYLTGERECDGDSAEILYSGLSGWEKWNELLPFSEWGFHTVSAIKIFHVESVENLLDYEAV